MAVPTYDGAAIFGIANESKRATRPRDAQANAYPGLDGTEHLDQGFRERMTAIRGLLYGATLADLNAAEILIESYDDGLSRAFVDSYGNAWANVVLRNYEPASKILSDPRGYFRQYHVTLVHLSIA